MDRKLEALKTAIERPNFKNALEVLRTGKSPGVERVKDKLCETEADKLELVQECLARGKRVAKAERRADIIEKTADDVAYLKTDRMAQKRRRGKAARQAGRDTKDSGLWDRYETFRAMKRHLDNAKKKKRRLTRLQAAKRVIKASKGAITLPPETLVRYYRAWIKKRKTD